VEVLALTIGCVGLFRRSHLDTPRCQLSSSRRAREDLLIK
jgi:hypothetical protein